MNSLEIERAALRLKRYRIFFLAGSIILIPLGAFLLITFFIRGELTSLFMCIASIAFSIMLLHQLKKTNDLLKLIGVKIENNNGASPGNGPRLEKGMEVENQEYSGNPQEGDPK
ncbi:MAG: hypothetical protein PHP64_06620 [Actinomycetota bacterium]|nr:hypothetical protein [Actinomycetota bacterium]